MKIEDDKGKYRVYISPKEIKKAFESEQNLKDFKDRIIDLLFIFDSLHDDSNK